jgi:hypothetical protein
LPIHTIPDGIDHLSPPAKIIGQPLGIINKFCFAVKSDFGLAGLIKP